MLKLFIFDMGGVMIRDFHIAPALFKFLNLKVKSFKELGSEVEEALKEHSRGNISEEEFWKFFNEHTSLNVDYTKESLLGKFFTPVLDLPTVEVVKDLKSKGYRVVCGTNVIDAHYCIHEKLRQYDVFEAVYPSHKLHIAKPDSAFYLEICKREKVSPQEAFFTDDLAENVEKAKSVGLTGCVYHDALQLKDELIGLKAL